MKRNVEILAPAGSWDSLCAAVCAGADAVYIGGEAFGLRAKAKNFTSEEMAHLAGIAQQKSGPVNHQGLADCARTIREEYQKSHTKTEEDIMLLREKLQKSKGINA